MNRVLLLCGACFLFLVVSLSPGTTESYSNERPANAPVDIPEIVRRRIDQMAHPSNCGKPDLGCRLECMPYKTSCLFEAQGSCFGGVPSVSRQHMSASEAVAWAIREAVERPGDKYRALAYLALGQCGDLHGGANTNRGDINGNKLAAYEYTLNNYVAGWRDVDPENHHGTFAANEGAAYKVGETYLNSPLDDCDHRNELSMIQIARPGIAVIVCADESGNPNDKEGCTPELIGPGTFILGEIVGSKGDQLNDRASYLRVFRK